MESSYLSRCLILTRDKKSYVYTVTGKVRVTKCQCITFQPLAAWNTRAFHKFVNWTRCITESRPRKQRRRYATYACRRSHISIRELTHCASRKVSRENFYLAYLLKIFFTKQIAQTPWRVKSFIAIDRSYSTGGSFHINWRSFDANMLTEGVTNMPSWVVITTICKLWYFPIKFMETTAEITSHFLKALCNFSLYGYLPW